MKPFPYESLANLGTQRGTDISLAMAENGLSNLGPRVRKHQLAAYRRVIRTALDAGFSKAKIARELGRDRKTIHHHIEAMS